MATAIPRMISSQMLFWFSARQSSARSGVSHPCAARRIRQFRYAIGGTGVKRLVYLLCVLLAVPALGRTVATAGADRSVANRRSLAATLAKVGCQRLAGHCLSTRTSEGGAGQITTR